MITFDRYRDRVIASFPAQNDDGLDVRVLETALPAKFYRVVTSQFTLTTGSDQLELALSMAVAISAGMLGVEDR